MQQEGSEILIISTIIIIVIVAFLVVLFTIFQRRKNKLLLEREEQRKKFEKEIAETQIEIREETLRNISWELHDNIGQLLTLAKIQLQHISEDNKDEITNTITKSLNELRALSKLINPEFIKNIKLKDAVQLEIDRFNRLNYIDAKLTVSGQEKPVEEKSGIIIFRMLQEFFSNTIKHSKASKLKVTIEYKKDSLEITSEDNGVGFNVNATTDNGIGLKNIKKRAEVINAEANFSSVPNKGTILKIKYYF